ncbi:MAG: hypothetical protein RL141_203 [Candidatus Parcubacteria bacterium]|jgi:small basic protein
MWISKRYLLLGIAFSLPFLIANALVAMQAQLFLSLLRPMGQTTGYEQVLVLTLIALVGAGGVVALLPLLKDKRLYIVNAIVGVVLIAFSLFAGYGLGVDVYRCDILNIPNCD